MTDYYGAVLRFEDVTGADIHVASFIGKTVALKPGFVYGVIEAIKLGTSPALKISGEWYNFKNTHIVILSED